MKSWTLLFFNLVKELAQQDKEETATKKNNQKNDHRNCEKNEVRSMYATVYDVEKKMQNENYLLMRLNGANPYYRMQQLL